MKLWFKCIDFRNNVEEIENYDEERTINYFIKNCLFNQHAMLFDEMTLVCSYEYDNVVKTFYLKQYNNSDKYKSIILKIKNAFSSINAINS